MILRNLILMCLIFLLFSGCNNSSTKATTEVWLTTNDQSILFQKQDVELPSEVDKELPTIRIDKNEQYQTIDGFGYTLTGGSARLINSMNENDRRALLIKLFASSETNIGTSYLRISVGASDLSDSVFTYNDLPEGQIDLELNSFSIQPELVHLIPVLKEIKAISPEVQIMGSPWSAPAWMKDNHAMIGGSLKPEYYSVYAKYLVKYIKAMGSEGVNIDALTVQNEPLHPGNNPSMFMKWEEQAGFVKNHLGPEFEREGITTKIIIYDHNADRPDYPISILNDEDARKYIDGSAFHLYAGTVDAISKVHEAHPDKNLYFTEQWIGGPASFGGDLNWHVEQLIIGATRNWCRTVLEWNLAADSNYEPHTDQGGCTRCLGAVTIDGSAVEYNPAYYIIAHASKFVRPGSVRVASNLADGLPNVAFLTPDNKVVLIVMNSSDSENKFAIENGAHRIQVSLVAKAVATIVLQD